ncbi:Uncharacterized protein Rs2_01019 [Raphanus sativus]|uniref:Uncharacterized protein LOC108851843 n=1 Tax=Raphanus sativus TaxID=3726 RepID=A0A6J0N7Z9_RAPSA|nr:uncharacterized protein LOC108851843 [Raphanus sativus]KAJ4915469.1 Uncharacterized protein Rs2_01019 [Raphanus sativus]
MGCCISATATATTDKKNEPDSGKNTAMPLAAVVEEETVVKEVLSETTLVTSLNDNSAMETTTNKVPEKEEEKKPGAVIADPDPVLTENGSVEPGKGSEVSEVCSLSESLLSIVSGGYDEEEGKQRKLVGVRQRSPAKYRDRVMANNYPTRRTDMSPRKRNTEGGEGAGGSVRLVPSGTGQRDQSGRSERRRSRSPATNRPVVVGPSRNHYATSTDNGVAMVKRGQSPGRVRPNPNKNGSEQDCHRQWPSQNDYSTSNDSFENPLVSLECFIFL